MTKPIRVAGSQFFGFSVVGVWSRRQANRFSPAVLFEFLSQEIGGHGEGGSR
jgi:hypothetical protein